MSKEVGAWLGRGERRELCRRGRREPGGRAESAPTARRLRREPWRPGSGGAQAENGTWFCGYCAASRLMRVREKSVWRSIAWTRR